MDERKNEFPSVYLPKRKGFYKRQLLKGEQYRKISNEGFAAFKALITGISLRQNIEKHLSGK